jgi:MFS family permease
VAVAVYAFRTSGVGAVGAVTAARLLPAVLAAPLTGGLIDRGDRARVVAIACVVQAACLGGAAALVLGGAPLALVVVLAASSAAATAPRPGFVAAVSGHGDASQLADAVVAEHLTRALTA